ncbi:MAG: hypothetical protein WCF62_20745, partial [Pseudolabrys sp.]
MSHATGSQMIGTKIGTGPVSTRPDRAGWRGLAGKKKARKLGLKTTPTYEIGWQTAYYKTAAL